MNKTTSSSKRSVSHFFQKIANKTKTGLIRMRELFLGRTKKQLEGEHPSFLGKKMLGLFGLFSLYSFILFALMNESLDKSGLIYQILLYSTFKNPYLFGITLTFTFIELSLIFCNDMILKWVFSKKYVLKQLIVIVILITGNYFLSRFILTTNFEIYALLLFFAMLWLIMQSVRIYWAARNGATKIEVKFSNQYSPFRYFITQITPLLILGILLFLSFIFRYGIVVYTLDYITVFVPEKAFDLYYNQMSRVMPMLYLGLLVLAVFLLIQRILSNRKGSTKRAGVYDTLTFAIIGFVMFLYAIYNIMLYLILDHQFLNAVSIVLNSGVESQSQSSGFFIFEFIITLIFLVWIIIDINKQFNNGILFFSNDGSVMFFLGTVFAQTTARLGLVLGKAQYSGGFAELIKYDYIVLPWLILLFLGITILIYWLKPQETSMFMHANEAAIDSNARSMETILAFFKREFIRRGEKFEITSQMIHSLINITNLPIGVVWSLIYRLHDKYIDVVLEKEVDDDTGKKKVIFDFMPITERYQKSKEAEKRAKNFLQGKFYESITKKKNADLTLKSKTTTSKQSDSFIQALSIQYGRKIKDEEIIKKSVEEQDLIIEKAIKEDTKFLVYKILKQAYIKRAKQISDYPDDIRFQISDIAAKIEKITQVPLGRVFPLVHDIAVENWNLNLSANVDEKQNVKDHLVEFLPIDDMEVYYVLEKYRPDVLTEVKVLIQLWFEKSIMYDKKTLENLPPLVYPDDDKEYERSYRSRWYAKLMHYFAENYENLHNQREHQRTSLKFQFLINKIINAKLKEQELKQNGDKRK